MICRESPQAEVPIRMSDRAAGYDLTCISDIHIPPGAVTKVAIGWSMSLPPKTVGRIENRSGIPWKHRVLVVPGTLDEDFFGAIYVTLWNLSSTEVSFPAKTRIAQLIILPVIHPVFEEVSTLESTGRSVEGYGSTGERYPACPPILTISPRRATRPSSPIPLAASVSTPRPSSPSPMVGMTGSTPRTPVKSMHSSRRPSNCESDSKQNHRNFIMLMGPHSEWASQKSFLVVPFLQGEPVGLMSEWTPMPQNSVLLMEHSGGNAGLGWKIDYVERFHAYRQQQSSFALQVWPNGRMNVLGSPFIDHVFAEGSK